MSDTNGQTATPGWTRATLAEIVEPRTGKAKPQATPTAKFIGLEQVEAHTMRLLGTIPAREMKSAANTFKPTDVLYGRMRSYLNKVYQPDFAGLCSGEFIVFPETCAVLGRFLKYRLNAGDFVRFATRINTGDRPRVDFDQIKVFELLLPPRPEQERIADALDELLSDLDMGVAALERAQAKLALYRAAVLKAAVEGTLTAEWRKQHPAAEPASVLLTRILAERRRRWEKDQLRKFKEAGKEPPNNWKAKYKEPDAPDTTKLQALPNGWRWATVEQASTKVVDGVHKKPNYVLSGIPFVTVRNLTAGNGISFEKLKYVTPEDHAQFIKRANPQRGDILISKDGTLGVIRVVETDIDFSIFVSVALVKPAIIEMSDFFCVALSSPQVQAQMVPKGSGLEHIHLEDLRQDCIPLPPLAEQEAIVEAVEDQLSVIEHLEADLEAKLKSAQALRQSILRHAFSGQLVPQDPNDEPAAELLKRIAAERAERTRLAASAKRTSKAFRTVRSKGKKGA